MAKHLIFGAGGDVREEEWEAPDVPPEPFNYAGAIDALKVKRDRLMAIVNQFMVQYLVDDRLDEARACRALVNPLKELPEHPGLAVELHSDFASFKDAACSLLEDMTAAAPPEVQAEVSRHAHRLAL